MPTSTPQFQRAIATVVYLAVLYGLFQWALATHPVADSGVLFWFYSGALMIILSTLSSRTSRLPLTPSSTASRRLWL